MKKMKKLLFSVVLSLGVLFATFQGLTVTAKAADTEDKVAYGPFINDMLAVTQEQVEGKRVIDWNLDAVKAYAKTKIPNAQDDGKLYTSEDGRYKYSVPGAYIVGGESATLVVDDELVIQGIKQTDMKFSGAEIGSNKNAVPISTKYTSLSSMGTIKGMNPVDYLNSIFADGEDEKEITFSDGTIFMLVKYDAHTYIVDYVSASERSGIGLAYEDGVLKMIMVAASGDEAFPPAVVIPGTTSPDPVVTADQTVMYRLYNPNSGEHFYTGNAREKDNLVSVGWSYEDVAWISPATSNTPVYRLYNPNSGEHHYTTGAGERDSLVAIGWTNEGIGWYADDNQTTPMYRLYNPNATGAQEAGAHHYTNSAAERDMLVSIGWTDEGIGWYGL